MASGATSVAASGAGGGIYGAAGGGGYGMHQVPLAQQQMGMMRPGMAPQQQMRCGYGWPHPPAHLAACFYLRPRCSFWLRLWRQKPSNTNQSHRI